MDWTGLITNLAAIFVGLFIYIGILHTKWGKEHEDYQYAIMLMSLIGACLVGGALRAVL